MHKIIVLLFACVLLASCAQEKGNKPIARGKGFGYDWKSDNPQGVFRVSVQNSFTRDAVVGLDGNGAHYELTVSPIGEGFMVVPKGDYKYSAWSFGRSVGETKIAMQNDERNGISGVMVKIRP